MEKLVIQYIQVVSWPIFLVQNVAEPRPEATQGPALHPQACMVGTVMTSASPYPPLFLPQCGHQSATG